MPWTRPGLRFSTLSWDIGREIDINIGPMDHEDTIRTCLIPVMPSLSELQEAGNHGDDVVGTAMRAMRAAIVDQDMVNEIAILSQNVHVQVFCRHKSESEIPLDPIKSACFLELTYFKRFSASA